MGNPLTSSKDLSISLLKLLECRMQWYNTDMEKDIFNINKNQLSYGRGYVYSLQYHLVWCTKYRKKVLKDGIDLECKKMLQDLAEEYRFQILAMEVMPDHIHMLVDLSLIHIFHGHQQRHQIADHATGLAADQLGKIGVLLLRHDG